MHQVHYKHYNSILEYLVAVYVVCHSVIMCVVGCNANRMCTTLYEFVLEEINESYHQGSR